LGRRTIAPHPRHHIVSDAFAAYKGACQARLNRRILSATMINKRQFSIGIVLMCAIFASSSDVLQAQDLPGPTTTALFAPSSPRSIGMGLTGVSDVSDPLNRFLNPAVVAYGDGISFGGGYNNFDGDLNQFDFGVSRANDRFGFAIHHVRVDRRITQLSGYKLNVHDSYGTMSGGAVIGDDVLRLGLGAAVRWNTADAVDDAPYLDVGLLVGGNALIATGSFHWQLALSALRLGDGSVSMIDGNNESQTLTGEDELRAGITVRMAVGRTDAKAPYVYRLSINAEGSDLDNSGAGGIELSVSERFFLRAGYRSSAPWPAAMGANDSMRTVGIGAAREIGFFAFRFDYGRILVDTPGAGVHSAALLFTFNV